MNIYETINNGSMKSIYVFFGLLFLRTIQTKRKLENCTVFIIICSKFYLPIHSNKMTANQTILSFL